MPLVHAYQVLHVRLVRVFDLVWGVFPYGFQIHNNYPAPNKKEVVQLQVAVCESKLGQLSKSFLNPTLKL